MEMVIVCFCKKHHFFHGLSFLRTLQVLIFPRMADLWETEVCFFVFFWCLSCMCLETTDIHGLVCGPDRTFHKHLVGQHREATWPVLGAPGEAFSFRPSPTCTVVRTQRTQAGFLGRGSLGSGAIILAAVFHPACSKARVSPRSRTSFSRPPFYESLLFLGWLFSESLTSGALWSVWRLSEMCLVFLGKAWQVLESRGMDGCPMDGADVSCCGNSQEGSTNLPCSRWGRLDLRLEGETWTGFGGVWDLNA